MPGTRPVLMCLSSVQGREAQFTVCEGFTSHPELARGQFRSSDRTPAFSPSPSLRPVSSTAPRAGASVRAGPGPTLAAPRPGGASWEGLLRVLRVTSQATGRRCSTPAQCGFLSYKGARPSSQTSSCLRRARSHSRPLVLLVMGRVGCAGRPPGCISCWLRGVRWAVRMEVLQAWSGLRGAAAVSARRTACAPEPWEAEGPA